MIAVVVGYTVIRMKHASFHSAVVVVVVIVVCDTIVCLESASLCNVDDDACARAYTTRKRHPTHTHKHTHHVCAQSMYSVFWPERKPNMT